MHRNADEIHERVQIEDFLGLVDYRAALADDVRRGLTREKKELPPKYFYDQQGSKLFEDICELPEYYQTRTERKILAGIAPGIVERYAPVSLVEFGSGSSSKTRVLLSAMKEAGTLRSYVPIDVSREMLIATSAGLVEEYPEMEVTAVIADFNDGLPAISRPSPSLIIFLGGTIGNFRNYQAISFLRRTAESMTADDIFLLGVDLVKDVAMLNAAYNDSAGVTAEFNLNVLRVINSELGGHFDLERFSHYSFYNPREEQIEMHLASRERQQVGIDALDLTVHFERGETIMTEISRKFTRASAEGMLVSAGMELLTWYTDPEELFALCLARRAVSG